jgi:two-component system sensor histidine kinase and response regulator WspE
MGTPGKIGILVVDDSVIVRHLLSILLMKYIRCEITEARDGLEAMEWILKEPFDLVITDINMPRMHGLALIQRIREEIGPSPPIIIVTTRGGDRDREQGLRLGANGYVTKPVGGVKLMQVVTDLLSGKRSGDRGTG